MSTVSKADSPGGGWSPRLAPAAAARVGALLAEPDAPPVAPGGARTLGILAVLLVAGLHAAGLAGSLGASAGVAQALSGSAREESSMGQSRKFGAMAGAVALSLAWVAAAQDAVQWRVEDGGNGHWYADDNRPFFETFDARQLRCAAIGGHLATVTSIEEHEFVRNVAFPTGQILANDTWPALGAFKPSGQSLFAWVTGEPIKYWPYVKGVQPELAAYLMMWGSGTTPGLVWTGNSNPTLQRAIIEWSADCNGDGIVDFGQIRDGSLDDANGNNIPDCCESGAGCNSEPRQWLPAQGGNGNWYGIITRFGDECWDDLAAEAVANGGHLATVTSASENAFVYDLARIPTGGESLPTYLGASQPADACEPGCGWAWVTGEPWSYTNWADLGCCEFDEDALELNSTPGSNGAWRDDRICRPGPVRAIVEWSADCNGDGIVDFGQIRDGSLDDANGNNIPDCCESGTPCNCPGDIVRDGLVNGIDLAAVLNNWGATGGGAIDADVNDDGIVNGADLSTVLGTWGPCE